ncbi:uncharacterized protein [Arachis hypogaea]|uniref:uncharacterized protein n=1 Tax=Arachis hypogaea TaxID=3818 RepID=UPI003B225C1A
MDDNIELELGAKPPISKPYRMAPISIVEGDIVHTIKEGLHHDPLAKKLVELVREGPFEIIGRVGEVAYKVQLPPSTKIQPVFYVSMLKPYHGDQDEPSRGDSSRAPPVVIRSFDKEIEEILANRIVLRRGVPPSIQYLIKWKGLSIIEASWETREDLWQFPEHLQRYHEQKATRTSAQ